MECKFCQEPIAALSRGDQQLFYHVGSGWKRCVPVSKAPTATPPDTGIYFTEAERLLLCKITEGYTAGGPMGEVLAKLHIVR